METPPQETVRRTTRSALAEIPARLGAITFSDVATPAVTRLSGGANLANIPASYISPSPSPDELVIQQRGRRKVPVTFSPDIDARKRQDRTPVKAGVGAAGANKSQIILRSTPRKRLLLNDPKEVCPSSVPPTTFPPSPSERRAKLTMSPNAKKVRVDPSTVPVESAGGGGGLESALRGLSNDQLISVIRGIVAKNPCIEQEIKECLPAPDLCPLEERLNDLKRNIYKSLPNSRLTSKTDSPAYARAALHVVAFKKCVLEQGRWLADAQQWPSVLEYASLAWAYVRATPLWDNPPHNAARRQCFKALAALCLTALRHLTHPAPAYLQQLHDRMESFVHDSEDFITVLKQIETMRKK